MDITKIILQPIITVTGKVIGYVFTKNLDKELDAQDKIHTSEALSKREKSILTADSFSNILYKKHRLKLSKSVAQEFREKLIQNSHFVWDDIRSVSPYLERKHAQISPEIRITKFQHYANKILGGVAILMLAICFLCMFPLLHYNKLNLQFLTISLIFLFLSILIFWSQNGYFKALEMRDFLQNPQNPDSD